LRGHQPDPAPRHRAQPDQGRRPLREHRRLHPAGVVQRLPRGGGERAGRGRRALGRGRRAARRPGRRALGRGLTRTVPAERDPRLDRLLVLVDGVFAIALTLLSFALHLPDSAARAEGQTLLAALIGTWPAVLSFLTSFAFIALF